MLLFLADHHDCGWVRRKWQDGTWSAFDEIFERRTELGSHQAGRPERATVRYERSTADACAHVASHQKEAATFREW